MNSIDTPILDTSSLYKNETYRLCVYEAGHTITAYLLNQIIVAVRLLPRPPMTFTEKKFISNSWDSFMDILESRALELFGGQIAELVVCGSTTCCSGDISRIDEISRILAGLSPVDDIDSEDILFDLEDRASAGCRMHGGSQASRVFSP